MKKTNKIGLILGSLMVVSLPLVSFVGCGSNDKKYKNTNNNEWVSLSLSGDSYNYGTILNFDIKALWITFLKKYKRDFSSWS
ncbi:MAG: hypothetical protein K4H23_05030 [Mollicutes bacterium PWAP]|nr:hypothetical protein [Mollicutes bacterium PWAP]